MQSVVDLGGCGRTRIFFQPPGVAEGIESFPPTFRTRSMSSCKSSCFVEEEEFGVMAGRHDRTLAAPKLQHAHDPPLPLPSPLNSAFLVMENATIAHEHAPILGGNDLTKWVYTVLPRHRPPCFIQTRKFGSFPRLLQLIVPETLDKMIVDHAHGFA